jgi:phage gpG-like protein
MTNVTPFPKALPAPAQTAFDRLELSRILDLYGRMVAAGQWRDYAIDLNRDVAIFSAFRRSAERPEFRIEKRPALRNRQGIWALIGESGTVLRRGQELAGILAPVERRLMKLVDRES